MRYSLIIWQSVFLLLSLSQANALAATPKPNSKSHVEVTGSKPALEQAQAPDSEITVKSARDLTWGAMFYYGWQTSTTMIHLAQLKDIHLARAHEWSLALSYQLDKDNWLRRLLRCLISTIEVVGNVTYQDDPKGNIFELNPYLLGRIDLITTRWIRISFAFGEGISYASKVPYWEVRSVDNAKNSRRFLNYLTYELVISIPKHPQWEIIYRVHHRSGVFGLYCPGRTSSTAMGVAIRYRF